jgi:hypothetical protein
VLLSTGYIAGGTIAGVLIAFLNFSEDIPKKLSVWQYSRYTLTQEVPLDQAYEQAAKYDLGLAEKEVSEDRAKELKGLTGQIAELNEGLVPQYAWVPKGTVLKLPGNRTHSAEESAYLSHYAEQLVGEADKATLLFDLNEDQLKPPKTLPAGAALKLPQHSTPALLAFGVLVLFLVLVGLGWLLQPRARRDEGIAPNHDLAEPRQGD